MKKSKLNRKRNRQKSNENYNPLSDKNPWKEKGGYINPMELIQQMMSGQVDYDKLMESVDWNRAKKDQEKANDEAVPQIALDTSTFEDKEYIKIPDDIQDKIEEYKRFIQTSPEKAIIFYSEMKEKYPNVKLIYNLLANSYMGARMHDQYFQIVQETVAKFPDYLFGKLMLAESYLRKEDLDGMYKALNEKLHLYYHFPKGQRGFHPSEIIGFYTIVGIYHAAKCNLPMALWCYSIIKEIGEDNISIERVAKAIVLEEIRLFQENADIAKML